MAYQGTGLFQSTSDEKFGQTQRLPEWIVPKTQTVLQDGKAYMTIHEFSSENPVTKIKPSPNGEFLVASATQPSQFKVYELGNKPPLKFQRDLQSEITDFQILSDDHSKLAILCADRSVSLHAECGSDYILSIPRKGKAIAYDCSSCELMCAASCPDLYIIQLDQGPTLSSLSTQSPALNVVCQSKLHGLIACGGEDGVVECFDRRMKPTIRLNVAEHTETIQEVTALEFKEDGGFTFAVGSSAGKVLLYDLRSSLPILVKNHRHGSPILDIKWHQTLDKEGTQLITSDKYIVEIWDPKKIKSITSIEPTVGTINDICMIPESGVMLAALDCCQIPSYFIPAIGLAPKWCSYLNGLTEEQVEQASRHGTYIFLTKEYVELSKLKQCINNNCLIPFKNGYFIAYNFYSRVKRILPENINVGDENNMQATVYKREGDVFGPQRKKEKRMWSAPRDRCHTKEPRRLSELVRCDLADGKSKMLVTDQPMKKQTCKKNKGLAAAFESIACKHGLDKDKQKVWRKVSQVARTKLARATRVRFI